MYRMKQSMLAIGDFFSFSIGFWLSLAARNWTIPEWKRIEQHAGLFFVLFVLWVIFNYINGLYDLERNSRDRAFYRRFAETTGLSLLLSVAFFYLLDPNIAPKTILLLNILFGYGLSFLWRLGYQELIGAKTLRTKVILAGDNEESRFLIDLTGRRPEKGYEIVALIDPAFRGESVRIPVYTSLDNIADVIRAHDADLVVIAPHMQKDSETERQLYHLLFSRVEITDLPSFYETITGRIPPSTFSEGWFLQNLRRTEKPIYDRARAVLDYAAGFGMLVFLGILFPFIAIAVKLNSPGPIFIKQSRIGKHGRLFLLYKFRSMYALSPDGSAEVHGVQFAQKDDKRITAVGKILRRTRLDELPQAWNLLKRDVTLIGPRPERPEIVNELEKRMPYYPLRHLVRPGLTGWALIHQNYTDNYDKSLQKLQYDLYYIKNRSVLLDAVIALRTVNVLIRLMGQ